MLSLSFRKIIFFSVFWVTCQIEQSSISGEKKNLLTSPNMILLWTCHLFGLHVKRCSAKNNNLCINKTFSRITIACHIIQ